MNAQSKDFNREDVFVYCNSLILVGVSPSYAMLKDHFKSSAVKLQVYLAEWKQENQDKLSTGSKTEMFLNAIRERDDKIAELEKQIGQLNEEIVRLKVNQKMDIGLGMKKEVKKVDETNKPSIVQQ